MWSDFSMDFEFRVRQGGPWHRLAGISVRIINAKFSLTILPSGLYNNLQPQKPNSRNKIFLRIIAPVTGSEIYMADT